MSTRTSLCEDAREVAFVDGRGRPVYEQGKTPKFNTSNFPSLPQSLSFGPRDSLVPTKHKTSVDAVGNVEESQIPPSLVVGGREPSVVEDPIVSTTPIPTTIDFGIDETWIGRIVIEFWPLILQFVCSKVQELVTDKRIDKAVEIVLKKLPVPSLPLRPWINQIFVTLWPLMDIVIQDIVDSKVLPAIRNALSPAMRKLFTIDASVKLGHSPPKISELNARQRVDPITGRKDIDITLELALDLKEAEIYLKFGAIAVRINNLLIKGKGFISLCNVIPRPPIVSGISIFVVEAPQLSFRLGGAAAIADKIYIYPIIERIIFDTIANLCLLPKRIAIPIDPHYPIRDIARPLPKGLLNIKILRCENLRAADLNWNPFSKKGATSDPFVVLRLGKLRFQSMTINSTLNPVWSKGNAFSFLCDTPKRQRIMIDVFDSDIIGSGDDKIASSDYVLDVLCAPIQPEMPVSHLVQDANEDGTPIFTSNDTKVDPITGAIVTTRWFNLVSIVEDDDACEVSEKDFLESKLEHAKHKCDVKTINKLETSLAEMKTPRILLQTSFRGVAVAYLLKNGNSYRHKFKNGFHNILEANNFSEGNTVKPKVANQKGAVHKKVAVALCKPPSNNKDGSGTPTKGGIITDGHSSSSSTSEDDDRKNANGGTAGLDLGRSAGTMSKPRPRGGVHKRNTFLRKGGRFTSLGIIGKNKDEGGGLHPQALIKVPNEYDFLFPAGHVNAIIRVGLASVKNIYMQKSVRIRVICTPAIGEGSAKTAFGGDHVERKIGGFQVVEDRFDGHTFTEGVTQYTTADVLVQLPAPCPAEGTVQKTDMMNQVKTMSRAGAGMSIDEITKTGIRQFTSDNILLPNKESIRAMVGNYTYGECTFNEVALFMVEDPRYVRIRIEVISLGPCDIYDPHSGTMVPAPKRKKREVLIGSVSCNAADLLTGEKNYIELKDAKFTELNTSEADSANAPTTAFLDPPRLTGSFECTLLQSYGDGDNYYSRDGRAELRATVKTIKAAAKRSEKNEIMASDGEKADRKAGEKPERSQRREMSSGRKEMMIANMISMDDAISEGNIHLNEQHEKDKIAEANQKLTNEVCDGQKERKHNGLNYFTHAVYEDVVKVESGINSVKKDAVAVAKTGLAAGKIATVKAVEGTVAAGKTTTEYALKAEHKAEQAAHWGKKAAQKVVKVTAKAEKKLAKEAVHVEGIALQTASAVPGIFGKHRHRSPGHQGGENGEGGKRKMVLHDHSSEDDHPSDDSSTESDDEDSSESSADEEDDQHMIELHDDHLKLDKDAHPQGMRSISCRNPLKSLHHTDFGSLIEMTKKRASEKEERNRDHDSTQNKIQVRGAGRLLKKLLVVTALKKDSWAKSKDDFFVSNLIGLLWPIVIKLGDDLCRALITDPKLDKSAHDILWRLPMPVPLNNSTVWINTVLATFWPLLDSMIQDILENKVIPGIQKSLPAMFAASIPSIHIRLGKNAPKISSTKTQKRTYKRGRSLRSDLDIFLGITVDLADSDIRISFGGERASLNVHDLNFDGMLVITLNELMTKPPFLTGVSVYFVNPCNVGFRFGGMVGFLDKLNLYPILQNVINDVLGGLCVLPKRIGVPLAPGCNPCPIIRPIPKGILQLEVYSAKNLRGDDWSISSFFFGGEKTCDPYVTISLGSIRYKTSIIKKNCNPVWSGNQGLKNGCRPGENMFLFFVDEPKQQKLDFQVYDSNLIGSDQKLAEGVFTLQQILKDTIIIADLDAPGVSDHDEDDNSSSTSSDTGNHGAMGGVFYEVSGGKTIGAVDGGNSTPGGNCLVPEIIGDGPPRRPDSLYQVDNNAMRRTQINAILANGSSNRATSSTISKKPPGLVQVSTLQVPDTWLSLNTVYKDPETGVEIDESVMYEKHLLPSKDPKLNDRKGIAIKKEDQGRTNSKLCVKPVFQPIDENSLRRHGGYQRHPLALYYNSYLDPTTSQKNKTNSNYKQALVVPTTIIPEGHVTGMVCVGVGTCRKIWDWSNIKCRISVSPRQVCDLSKSGETYGKMQLEASKVPKHIGKTKVGDSTPIISSIAASKIPIKDIPNLHVLGKTYVDSHIVEKTVPAEIPKAELWQTIRKDAKLMLDRGIPEATVSELLLVNENVIRAVKQDREYGDVVFNHVDLFCLRDPRKTYVTIDIITVLDDEVVKEEAAQAKAEADAIAKAEAEAAAAEEECLHENENLRIPDPDVPLRSYNNNASGNRELGRRNSRLLKANAAKLDKGNQKFLSPHSPPLEANERIIGTITYNLAPLLTKHGNKFKLRDVNIMRTTNVDKYNPLTSIVINKETVKPDLGSVLNTAFNLDQVLGIDEESTPTSSACSSISTTEMTFKRYREGGRGTVPHHAVTGTHVVGAIDHDRCTHTIIDPTDLDTSRKGDRNYTREEREKFVRNADRTQILEERKQRKFLREEWHRLDKAIDLTEEETKEREAEAKREKRLNDNKQLTIDLDIELVLFAGGGIKRRHAVMPSGHDGTKSFRTTIKGKEGSSKAGGLMALVTGGSISDTEIVESGHQKDNKPGFFSKLGDVIGCRVCKPPGESNDQSLVTLSERGMEDELMSRDGGSNYGNGSSPEASNKSPIVKSLNAAGVTGGDSPQKSTASSVMNTSAASTTSPKGGNDAKPGKASAELVNSLFQDEDPCSLEALSFRTLEDSDSSKDSDLRRGDSGMSAARGNKHRSPPKKKHYFTELGLPDIPKVDIGRLQTDMFGYLIQEKVDLRKLGTGDLAVAGMGDKGLVEKEFEKEQEENWKVELEKIRANAGSAIDGFVASSGVGGMAGLHSNGIHKPKSKLAACIDKGRSFLPCCCPGNNAQEHRNAAKDKKKEDALNLIVSSSLEEERRAFQSSVDVMKDLTKKSTDKLGEGMRATANKLAFKKVEKS